MANFMTGLSGAGAGAAAGASIGGPIGGAIGGGIGFLGGLFGGGDSPDLPELHFSNDSMAKLHDQFPELAQSIQANKLAYGDLSKQVALAQQGPTQRERAGQAEYMDQQRSAQAMSGMAGQPMANAMIADAQARTSGAMYDQNQQRLNQLLGMQQQAGASIASQYGNLGQMQNSARGQNIQNSMERDAAMAGRQMTGYNAGRQDASSFNQGMGALGGMAYNAWANPYTHNMIFGDGASGGQDMSMLAQHANSGKGPYMNQFGPQAPSGIQNGQYYDLGNPSFPYGR